MVVRKLVLATGVEGTGGPRIPQVLDGLGPGLAAHAGHAIDFAALRGRSVGVLGAASSAFDAAAVALEAGAASVHLFCRRPDLVVAGPGGTPPSAAVQEAFHRLPDEERWRRRWTAATAGAGASVPLDSVQRATAFPNFHLHLGAPWHDAVGGDGVVRVAAEDGAYTFDFVIAGTGYQSDPRTRAELNGIAERIALWRDVYEPPAALPSEHLGSFPYVGAGYQLTARHPDDAAWVGNIHAFNVGASQSFGLPVSDVPSLPAGVPRLVGAIAHDLVVADLHRRPPAAGPGSLRDSYAHAIWRPLTTADGRGA